MTDRTGLKRNITLPLLVLYGLGTTVGAGIYALIGEIAGEAGSAAPLAFLVAACLAGLTASSFAELSARYPRSAGEAVYVREAFGTPALASLVGLLVALSGCVSAATIANGFAGYLDGLVDIPRAAGISLLIALLTGIAAWGVRASVVSAGLITLIEVGGLLIITWGAREALGELPTRYLELLPGELSGAGWAGVMGGSLLAFYAFLGFEDMVNVAEEVKQVRRTLPVAIMATLVLTTILYALIATVAVLTVPAQDLAESGHPLTLLYRAGGGRFPEMISGIALLAMLNGSLIQIVMASRIAYGLAGQPLVPRALGYVHPRTATPLLATLLVGGFVVVLALLFPLKGLAATTSLLTLLIFSVVNAALIKVRMRDPTPPVWTRPAAWIPVGGMVFNLALFGYSVGAGWGG